jgi:hypothetical protein
MLKYRAMISKTKSKKPIFGGRFSSLPPIRRQSVQMQSMPLEARKEHEISEEPENLKSEPEAAEVNEGSAE